MKVINFFGGPGTGKSTIASFLFSQLKIRHYKSELITEYAKDCVYENRNNIIKSDQLYIFAKQNHKLKMLESYQNGIEYAVTDSPLILSNIYPEVYGNFINVEFKNLVLSTFNSYKNINFFLEKSTDFEYEECGRLQNADDSNIIHNKIKNYLNENNIEFETIFIDENLDSIINKILCSKQMKNK